MRLSQTISFAMLMQTMEGRPTDRGVEELAERMDERFDLVDARFELVDKRFDDVSAEFQRIDKRFDDVSAEFHRIDKRFDAVSAEFQRIDSRFQNVEADIREIRGDLESKTEKIRSELQSTSESLSGDIKSMQRNMLYGFMTLAVIIASRFSSPRLTPARRSRAARQEGTALPPGRGSVAIGPPAGPRRRSC